MARHTLIPAQTFTDQIRAQWEMEQKANSKFTSKGTIKTCHKNNHKEPFKYPTTCTTILLYVASFVNNSKIGREKEDFGQQETFLHVAELILPCQKNAWIEHACQKGVADKRSDPDNFTHQLASKCVFLSVSLFLYRRCWQKTIIK